MTPFEQALADYVGELMKKGHSVEEIADAVEIWKAEQVTVPSSGGWNG